MCLRGSEDFARYTEGPVEPNGAPQKVRDSQSHRKASELRAARAGRARAGPSKARISRERNHYFPK